MSITLERSVSRREFLLRTGWMAGGLTVLSSCAGLLPVLPHQEVPEEESGLSWVQILSGGQVRFYCPRMEMGQGVSIALTQLVAEELNIEPASISCVAPNTNQVPPFKLTVGSQSIELFHAPVSTAAASLREDLRKRAARSADVDVEQVLDAVGGFRLTTGRVILYADLVPAVGEIISLDKKAVEPGPLKVVEGRREEFTAVGRSLPDPVLRDLVTGKEIFSRDASLPNLMHGGTVFPPVHGARIKDADTSKARAVPSVVAVVIEHARGLAGVVAENPHQVGQALAVLQIDWDRHLDAPAEHPAARIHRFWHGEARDFEHELLSAGADKGEVAADRQLTGVYQTPFLAHAAIEPRAGLAWVQKNKTEVWCGTQAPFFVQGRIAQQLGCGRDEVTVHPLRMGGAFGGRVPCQPVETAALLSRASGHPVKVQWSREDEFRHNYLQPPFFHEIRAGVDDKGAISHWHHDFASAPILFGLREIPEIAHIVLDNLPDKGTARGALSPYRAANKRIRYSDIRLPVSTGAWRGLGTLPNNFAVESMMDELAHKAETDPLRFRLNNLDPGSQRLAPVLNKAAEMAGWGRTLARGHGLGIAGGIYREKTFVAAVVEVRVSAANQDLAVERIWLAQDCGLVINPDQVEQQIAGNAIWGLSVALGERMVFEGGLPDTVNFDTYSTLRQSQAPAIEVALIEPRGSMPTGSGEPAIGPIAPAISNAIFAASGQRVRTLPIDAQALFGAA